MGFCLRSRNSVGSDDGSPLSSLFQKKKSNGSDMDENVDGLSSVRTTNHSFSTHSLTSACSELSILSVDSTPPSLRCDAWSEPRAEDFDVRDVGYTLSNWKRSKRSSEISVFSLLTVDIVRCPEPNYGGLCSLANERVQLALEHERRTGERMLPNFIFAINLCVPTPSNEYNHVVFYFGLDDVSLLRDQSTPLGRVAEPFFFGHSDEYRDKTFKLIPRIVDGSYLVRKAVGSKPSVLGTKVKQHYISNERYFELIVDIGSDAIANSIVKLALGYSKALVVDMMFVLEGHDESMLPERILGGVRMNNVDLKGEDGQRGLN